MGEIFFNRSSAVFRRRTSDLVHLTICFPRIRSSQRIIARVEWELAISKKIRNRTRTNISEISIQSAMEAVSESARFQSQLSEDGLFPRFLAWRSRTDCPWAATFLTAVMAVIFLLIGDPIWLIAAAN